MKRLMIFALLATAVAAGCSSSSSSTCAASLPASCPTTPPSYKTDVAPLLQTYCVTCHVAGGEEGDKPLDTYQSVVQQSSDINKEVIGCSMPPSDEKQPTDAERETIAAWIVCGASDN